MVFFSNLGTNAQYVGIKQHTVKIQELVSTNFED